MKVFFDTEFTDINPYSTPALISIGLVSEDECEFYAELTDTWSRDQCSGFVIETVLPLLNNDCRMFEAQVVIRLKDFIESMKDEVILVCDSPEFDWSLVAKMFERYNCWPANLHKECNNICYEIVEVHRYRAGLDVYWKDSSRKRHHALDDAKSLLFAWKFSQRGGKEGQW